MGTALIGSVAGVAALCATAVFGSSLAHLTTTPALYGAPFQDFFNSSGPGAIGQDPLIKELEGDRAIGRITLVSVPAVTVNRVNVRAIAATAVRGPMLLSAAEGRLPAGDDQIALGASTMRDGRSPDRLPGPGDRDRPRRGRARRTVPGGGAAAPSDRLRHRRASAPERR